MFSVRNSSSRLSILMSKSEETCRKSRNLKKSKKEEIIQKIITPVKAKTKIGFFGFSSFTFVQDFFYENRVWNFV